MLQFNQQLTSYRSRINQVLQDVMAFSSHSDNSLIAAMRYATLLGGKRLRPYLVYATGEMFGTPLATLDPIAAAIECLHCYSLIHDDLPAMDNDTLRRGKPTCHIQFDEATAILAGDALQTLAFRLLCDGDMPNITTEQRLSLLQELAHASGHAGMCLGQCLDLQAEGKHIELAALENIHQYKTGFLIRAAVRLGALTAGELYHPFVTTLDSYAQAIGLAFQIQDDILDVVGDSVSTGKQQGGDQRLNKSTYPALLGLEAAQQKAIQLCQQARAALLPLKQQYDISTLDNLATFIVQRNN